MNDTTILYLKRMNHGCARNEIIRKILNDEACFFKMKQEDAYIILEDIGVGHDKVASLYDKLISYDNYYALISRGALTVDDPELVIKYGGYDPSQLFKKNN